MVLFPANATNQKSILITEGGGGGGVEKGPKIYIFYNTIFLLQEICSLSHFSLLLWSTFNGNNVMKIPKEMFLLTFSFRLGHLWRAKPSEATVESEMHVRFIKSAKVSSAYFSFAILP